MKSRVAWNGPRLWNRVVAAFLRGWCGAVMLALVACSNETPPNCRDKVVGSRVVPEYHGLRPQLIGKMIIQIPYTVPAHRVQTIERTCVEVFER